jgi:hypothetical protein
MPSARYEKYQKPIPPADPDAEYLTIQETAHVLGIAVKTARRALKELDRDCLRGRRIKTDREDRAAMAKAYRINLPVSTAA